MKMNDQPAILGGKPVRTKPFPIHPVVSRDAIKAVVEILKKGHLSQFYKNPRGGEKVQALEKAFAEYHGIKHAISVNSGTAALHVALEACLAHHHERLTDLPLSHRPRVLVPAYTFTSTATAVLMAGAIPTLIDVNPEDGNISLTGIEDALKVFPNISAIIPVHIMGMPANMVKILEFACSNNLKVIEDCAQAAGATIGAQKVGTFGDFGCFSMQHTKPIPAGEGGMITTNDDHYAERCILIRNHGEIYGEEGRGADIIGYNYRMVEYVAALALEMFKDIDRVNANNRRNAEIINDAVSQVPFLHIMKTLPGAIYSRYCFRILNNEFYEEIGVERSTQESLSKQPDYPRSKFLEALEAEGINMNGGYKKALYEYPLFARDLYLFSTKFGLHYPGTYYSDLYPGTDALVHQQAIWFENHLYPSTQKDAQDVANAILKVGLNMKEIYVDAYKSSAIRGQSNV
jgi:perosamine synthetase